MAEIPLTQGKVALVDAADLPLLAGYAWYARKAFNAKTWYATASVYTRDSEGKRHGYSLQMHRLILPGADPIDHRDMNGLNNQRANIRRCTPSQNMMNRGKRAQGTSRFKGVCWDKEARRWRAEIRRDGILRQLGRFTDEAAAARAYNIAALELFGEFARLNDLGDPHGQGECGTTPQSEPQRLKV